MANVSLAGFPPVMRISFFQGSSARPGRLVVDSLIAGTAGITAIPKQTSLTIAARNYLGTWADLKLVKSPRVHRHFVRSVFEDSRWKLRNATLSGNWNRRDMRGTVTASTSRTITQLLLEIGSASGLTFTTGSLPNFQPPAPWSGMRADLALSRLLHVTGCRMVYEPEAGAYNVSQAGTGPLPNATERLFRPGPTPQIRNLIVRSAPVLYEDRLDAEAAKLDADGSIITDAAPSLPTDLTFSRQADLRLWKPTAVTHPGVLDPSDIVLNPHRAASLVPFAGDPVMIGPELFFEDWEYWPTHLPGVLPSASVADKVVGTGGGEAILFDHPMIASDGTGSFKKDATLLASYYVKDDADGTLRVAEKSASINPAATSDLIRTFDWITPVDSTEADMAATSWDALLTSVMNAIASRYTAPAQSLRLFIPIPLSGSGQVGAVHYYANAWNRRLSCSVAINFDPRTHGSQQLT